MSLAIACHNDAFGTTGQIDPLQLEDILAQGYKSVINNRPDFEGGPSQPLNEVIEAKRRVWVCNTLIYL